MIAGLSAAVPGYDVCVVDDGSTDDTAQVAARLGATVLRCPLNLGIGEVVQAGYLWARDRGYDVAIQIDGDDQHDATSATAVMGPIAAGEADVVIGSRFLNGDGFRSSALRRAGIRYLAWFLRLRCGARVTDPTSGFRAAGRKAIALFAALYPSDYPEPCPRTAAQSRSSETARAGSLPRPAALPGRRRACRGSGRSPGGR